ncbi:hypothetical protein EJ04DRAFT_587172, partial [Polyplosphaeria fusca]
GDFISAILVFKTVCDALREHGGAATAYQEAVTWLDGVHDILKNLESLPDSIISGTGSAELTKAFDSLNKNAEACLNRVKEFNKKLKKYDPTLGAGAPQGWKRGTWSKANWALYFSKEFEKVREEIGAYTLSITIAFVYLSIFQSLQR